MKNILLYGDSNTWGFNPDFTCQDDLRFVRDERWGGVLQRELGEEYFITEEGLGGRTTTLEDPAAPGRSGLALLAPIVQSHQPLDLLVFLLGTNDMKNTYRASLADIRRGMELCCKTRSIPIGGIPTSPLKCWSSPQRTSTTPVYTISSTPPQLKNPWACCHTIRSLPKTTAADFWTRRQ